MQLGELRLRLRVLHSRVRAELGLPDWPLTPPPTTFLTNSCPTLTPTLSELCNRTPGLAALDWLYFPVPQGLCT